MNKTVAYTGNTNIKLSNLSKKADEFDTVIKLYEDNNKVKIDTINFLRNEIKQLKSDHERELKEAEEKIISEIKNKINLIPKMYLNGNYVTILDFDDVMGILDDKYRPENFR